MNLSRGGLRIYGSAENTVEIKFKLKFKDKLQALFFFSSVLFPPFHMEEPGRRRKLFSLGRTVYRHIFLSQRNRDPLSRLARIQIRSVSQVCPKNLVPSGRAVSTKSMHGPAR